MSNNTHTNTVATREATAATAPQASVLPPVDIVESDNGFSLYADLPGVSRERLEIQVDGDQLVIQGAATVPLPEQLSVLHSEVRNPLFRRAFTLSRELDASKIEANLKDGVLKLHIPKAEAARPRRIEVRVG